MINNKAKASKLFVSIYPNIFIIDKTSKEYRTYLFVSNLLFNIIWRNKSGVLDKYTCEFQTLLSSINYNILSHPVR